MSHRNVVYPFSEGDLIRGDDPSLVGEEGAGYSGFRKSFLQYVDLVDNALPKAKAIAWLLHDGDIAHEATVKEASLAIVDYIDEALAVHRELYEQYLQSRDRER